MNRLPSNNRRRDDLWQGFRAAMGACAVTAFTLFGWGCDSSLRGSGVAKTEQRNVESFERIVLKGGATLNVTVGSTGPLEISADDNILPLIASTVSNKVLTIEPTESINPKHGIVIKVSTESLLALTCQGAAKVDVRGVNSEQFDINIQGAASVSAQGTTGKLTATLSGAGLLDLKALAAKDATVKIFGTGSADVTAESTLSASVFGTGRITYGGTAKVDKTIQGVGIISER